MFKNVHKKHWYPVILEIFPLRLLVKILFILVEVWGGGLKIWSCKNIQNIHKEKENRKEDKKVDKR